jgi:hypothetical protein
MSVESEQIKKLRVRYLKCSKGDMHEGEVLNFICIDPACRNKGLICPVCQNTTHDQHQTLHLKLFLAEINKTLYNAEETSELSGLAEYLRSLDSSKREMVKSLREMVEQLAGKVREVEEKIEKGYCLLRKIILSQVTPAIPSPPCRCDSPNSTASSPRTTPRRTRKKSIARSPGTQNSSSTRKVPASALRQDHHC